MKHLTIQAKGIGIWDFASTNLDEEPDVVIASWYSYKRNLIYQINIIKKKFSDLK